MPRLTVIKLISLGLCVSVGGVEAQPAVLGGVVTAAAHPQLAAAPDGSIHLLFQGRLSGGSVISHRVLRGGVWSDEAIVSAADEDQASPVITVGAGGTVHAVWSERIGDRWAVVHSALEGDEWGPFHILSAEGAADSQFPSVAARPDGGVEVVWQTARASGYLVTHATWSPVDGASAPLEIGCQTLDGYNVYPQIFLTPSPVICWHEYDLRDGDFALRCAEWVPGAQWRRIPFEDLLLVDPSRLPCLLLSDVGEWAALWFDVSPLHDRVIFGRGGEPTFGSAEIIDENPEFENDSPCAAAVGDGRWVVAWRGETPLGPEIFLAAETEDGWRQEMLSGGETLAAAEPTLCVVGGMVHVVWTSDVHGGGTGSLAHAAVPLP